VLIQSTRNTVIPSCIDYLTRLFIFLKRLACETNNFINNMVITWCCRVSAGIVRQEELWKHTRYMSKNLMMPHSLLSVYFEGVGSHYMKAQIWHWWVDITICVHVQIVTLLLQVNWTFSINHQKTQYLLYIHNVSHNSLICLMIGAANIEIIRLHLKC